MKKHPIGMAVLALLFFILTTTGHCGETPSEVYSKVHNAFLQKDVKTVLKYCTASEKEKFTRLPYKEQDEMLSMIQGMIPTVFKVESEKIEKDEARLVLSGTKKKSGKVRRMLGKAFLVKENGLWKLLKIKWDD